MDKKNYIMKQLHRTHNKKYENYVITGIWHLLNDTDIKIITQQYIIRKNNKYALADLYFPQFNLIVEVNESYHLKQEELDNIRSRDIVNASHFIIRTIDTSKSIVDINNQITEIVKYINSIKKNYQKWNYDKEFDNKQYIDKGFIDINDNAMFRKEVDACNCFGNNYKAFRGGVSEHKYIDNVTIWFPKLFKHREWENSIDINEVTIYECNIDKEKNEKAIKDWVNSSRNVRYAFAQSKDNLGRILYRFKGEYTLNPERTLSEHRGVWERTNTRVRTIKYNEYS